MSHHIQFKTFGIIPALSFFHEKSKHEFGSGNPGGCFCVSHKSRAAFQLKPSINLIFVILLPDPCLRWEPWKSWNAHSVLLVGSATSCPHDSSVLLAFSGSFIFVMFHWMLSWYFIHLYSTGQIEIKIFCCLLVNVLVFSAWNHSRFGAKVGIFSFQRGRMLCQALIN